MKPRGATLGAGEGRERGGQGFTLVEMLVALALLGLISVVLFSSFRLGVRAWEAGSVSAQQTSEVEAVQNLLRKQLSQATQLSVGPEGDRAEFIFAGSPEELRFSAPMLAHLGTGGDYVFDLSTDGAGENRDLVLRWRVYRPDMSLRDDRWSEPLVLIHGAAGISIEYFGRSGDEERPVWRDTWDHRETLPNLIRLRLAFSTADRRRWPELLVAPKTQPVEAIQ